MQALRHVDFEGPVSFDARILQLTKLMQLASISLTNLRPHPKDTTVSCLARLTYQLAANCPDIKFLVDGAPV